MHIHGYVCLCTSEIINSNVQQMRGRKQNYFVIIRYSDCEAYSTIRKWMSITDMQKRRGNKIA